VDGCCQHCAGALNDYQKDLQFRKLNAQKDVIEVKVVRDGKTELGGKPRCGWWETSYCSDTGDKVSCPATAVKAWRGMQPYICNK